MPCPVPLELHLPGDVATIAESRLNDEYKSNTYSDAQPNFAIEWDVGALPIEMSLEHQPGMLPHSVKLNNLPALLGNAQFRSERSQEGRRTYRIVGDPMGVGIDKPF